uniref:Putative ribonuclease H-like domain-containing protein n=1 Tax=Tanacetum cinerariifolium TaxID=118510 RepID=A0A6L2NYG6_TANCI|nr:putative ribonuclease H-like domain-containing protein [Tanacetum cinerariifolium]
MSANDKFRLGYGDYRYGSTLSYENEVLQSVFMNMASDLEDTPVNNRFANEMHAVPPPMTGNYMPSGPDVEIDYSKFTYGPKQTSDDESDSKPSEYASCESDSSVEPSTSMPEPVENASKVVCEPKVWTDAPIIEEYKSDSDNDSVHMTGNKAHLADYQGFKGGSIAFGGSNGRITEVDNTACYVLNRVLVTKPQNKTPYELLTVENQANKSACPKEANISASTQANDDQGANSEEIDLQEEHFVLPIWSAYSTNVKSLRDRIEKNISFKTSEKPVSQVEQNTSTSSTNLINTDSTPISIVGPSRAFNDGELSYPDPFKNKKDGKGVVVRNKARLVAQGHRQEEGIDYDEVFAPVARIEAIRIFLAFASTMGFIVYQMDMKSAFMNGIIDEEVYVSQPPSFVDPKFPNKVYKVVKALYGLHKALKAWYATLSTFLEKSRYRRGAIDKTLFIKHDKKDIMLVQVYVDDIIFGSTKKSWCVEFEELIKNSVKTASTPIETQKPLVKDEEAADVDVHIYRFQVTPKTSHLQAVKRIFRYLKGQPKLGLWYPKVSSFDLEAYSDSDYTGANLDKKSTTGGCQFLGRRLILWQYKKQTIMATSTTEAEYVIAAYCCGQVLWIHNQLLDYGFNFMNTKIYIDNESIICIIKNLVFYSKTKHIEIRHHFIRDAYEKKLIQVLKIHTDDNVADLLTKAFNVSKFNFLCAKKNREKDVSIKNRKKAVCKNRQSALTTAKVKTINDEVRIQALTDEKRINIKESSIRRTLKLDDVEGTSCLANAKIFDGLAKMGYEKLSENLTFYKAFFLPQWKFLIHTILQCLRAKTTSSNEFSSTMASAIICLATNQKFNFSRYILLSLVKNIKAGVPFFMFPRFVQLLINHQLGDMSPHKDIYDSPSLTKKVFANMKRVGTGFSRVFTSLFDNMLVLATEEVGLIQDDVQSVPIPTEPSTSKPHKKHKLKKQQSQAPKVPSPERSPEHRLPSPSNDPLPGERIEKLEGRVDKLEEENKVLKELHSVHSKVDIAAPVVEKEKSFKQGRIIDLDEDVKINLEEPHAKPYRMDLEHQEKVLSMQDVNDEEPTKVKEVLEVVKAAKLMTKVVKAAKLMTEVVTY